MVVFGWEVITDYEKISFRGWYEQDFVDSPVLLHLYTLNAINGLFSNTFDVIELAHVPLFF